MHGSPVNALRASAPGFSSVRGFQARNASLSPRWGVRDDMDTLLSEVGGVFNGYKEIYYSLKVYCGGVEAVKVLLVWY